MGLGPRAHSTPLEHLVKAVQVGEPRDRAVVHKFSRGDEEVPERREEDVPDVPLRLVVDKARGPALIPRGLLYGFVVPFFVAAFVAPRQLGVERRQLPAYAAEAGTLLGPVDLRREP